MTLRSSEVVIGCQIFRRQVETRAMQFGQSLAVDIFFQSRNAYAVEVGKAKNMRGNGAVWVYPLVLGKKTDTRQAEPVDFLLLLRGNRALDPNEAFAGAEALPQFTRVDVWKHGG